MMQEYFRTFGFLDCMQLAMCKPGSGPINSDDERNPEMWILQRTFFYCVRKYVGNEMPRRIFCNGSNIDIFQKTVCNKYALAFHSPHISVRSKKCTLQSPHFRISFVVQIYRTATRFTHCKLHAIKKSKCPEVFLHHVL